MKAHSGAKLTSGLGSDQSFPQLVCGPELTGSLTSLSGIMQAELELQAEEMATLRLQLAQARAAAEQRAELARRCGPFRIIHAYLP